MQRGEYRALYGLNPPSSARRPRNKPEHEIKGSVRLTAAQLQAHLLSSQEKIRKVVGQNEHNMHSRPSILRDSPDKPVLQNMKSRKGEMERQAEKHMKECDSIPLRHSWIGDVHKGAAERIANMRACRELAASLRDLLEEGPAGISSHSHLTSTLVEVLFEADIAADRGLSAASQEAELALRRMRAVNATLLSNLDFICAQTTELENTLNTCLAANERVQKKKRAQNARDSRDLPAKNDARRLTAADDWSDTDCEAPSEQMQQALTSDALTQTVDLVMNVLGNVIENAQAKDLELSSASHELAAAKQQVSRLHDELRDMQHKREAEGRSDEIQGLHSENARLKNQVEEMKDEMERMAQRCKRAEETGGQLQAKFDLLLQEKGQGVAGQEEHASSAMRLERLQFTSKLELQVLTDKLRKQEEAIRRMEAEHRNLKRSNKAEDSPPSPQTYRFSSDTAPRTSDTGDRYHQYHTPHDAAQHRRSESEDAKEAGGHTKGFRTPPLDLLRRRALLTGESLSDEKLLRGIDARNNSIQELQVLLKEVAPDSYSRHGDTVLPSHLHLTRRSLSPAAEGRSERHGVPSAHTVLSESECTRSVLSPRVSWTSAGGSGPTRLMGASGLEQQYQGPQSPGTVKNMFPSGSTRLMGTRGHVVSCDGPLGVANSNMQGENNVPDCPLVSVSPVSAGTDVLTELSLVSLTEVSPRSVSSPLFQF